MQKSERKYNRIVIKIGSSILSLESLKVITAQIAELARQNKEVVIVSSGAIACGMSRLGLKLRPKELSYLQAAAAIGQNQLMNMYCQAFSQKGLTCAQVLLTWEDFNDRKRYLNAKNTIQALLKLKVVPVINENDTVSIDEIKFGDNDRLSALVASLIRADLLLILSDVDGLMTEDRKEVIRVVDEITPSIRRLACGTNKKTCVGGMITKLDAAKMSLDSGIPCVIINGRKENVILAACQDIASCGTLFAPKAEGLEAKKRWIAFGTKEKGKIIIDDGAAQALIKNGKSLLSPGIVAVEGNFSAGSVVVIFDQQNAVIGRGVCALASEELKKVMGKRYHKEIIHRNNLVIV